MIRLILLLAVLGCSSCNLHQNLKCDGPDKTHAHEWANVTQDTQLALPMGGTRLFFTNVWYYFNVIPPDDYQTQRDRHVMNSGPMTLWCDAVLLTGTTLEFSGTLVGDILTLPYTMTQ